MGNDFNQWLRTELRRISYKHPPRQQALKEARVSRGKYRCNLCENIFRPKEIQVDHVEPVVDPKEGFVDWNTFISRLFADKGGWQVLCKPCHDLKTQAENNERRCSKQ